MTDIKSNNPHLTGGELKVANKRNGNLMQSSEVSKRFACKSEANIENECVVYPGTLTSFNPSKLTSF